MSDKNNPVHVKKSDCHIFLSDLHKILAEFMSKFAAPRLRQIGSIKRENNRCKFGAMYLRITSGYAAT